MLEKANNASVYANGSTYTYDSFSNRTKAVNENGQTTLYAYDLANNLISVTNSLGNTTRFGYDSVGNRTVMTDALGHVARYDYDGMNRVVTTTDSLSGMSVNNYDAAGNLASSIDQNGQITNYGYDVSNQLISVSDSMGNVTRYGYDAVGNRTVITDANGHATRYEYDPLSRPVTITNPLGQRMTYGYDAVGNRTSRRDRNGATADYAYDPNRNLTQVSYGGTTIQYAYDAVGNRKMMTDTIGVTGYNYDRMGRVSGITFPGGGTVSYSYDALGNRTSIVYPDSRVVTSTYDMGNRLVGITDWAGRVLTYTYDTGDRLTGAQLPNQTQTSYSYDENNRLIGVAHTSSVSGTIESITYGIDRVGNRTMMTDTSGVTTYVYDNLYRLTQVTYPDSTVVSYQYDGVGNRTVMTDTGGTISYSYDEADRLQTAGNDTFTWDANGNMRTRATPGGTITNTYDLLDRLTQVLTGTDSYQYAYDGDGTRMRKTINGNVMNYLWDKTLENPVVLTDTNSVYQYGLGLVAQQSAVDSAYYHTDGLGSIRSLTNAGGQVIGGYGYDVFGTARSLYGSNSNDFRFAGEQLDSETGMYYLRARYYDPGTGRFTSPDPITPGPRNTRALNAYSYGYNNPVNLVDPSGKYTLFIGGVGTTYQEEIDSNSNWASMDKALGDIGEQTGYFDWTAGGKHQSSLNPLPMSTQRPVDEAAKDLANHLYWIARNKLAPGETIKLVGHSKGGALIMEYLAQIAEGTAKQDELVFRSLSDVFTLDAPLDLGFRSKLARFDRGQQGVKGFDRIGWLPERLSGITNVRITTIQNPDNWVGHGPLSTDSPRYTYGEVNSGGWLYGHFPGWDEAHGRLPRNQAVIQFIVGSMQEKW